MKVKIQTRRVYHKFAEVEVEVSADEFEKFKLDNGGNATLQDFLISINDLYEGKIEDALSNSEYEYGFGLDSDANTNYNSSMNEMESEEEWRYDCTELQDGGHL